ncbi:hypothetical protein D1953_13110 [Peribacillus asahii]|uniref:Metal-dependent peptidase n=1 Tax=Peribacillus asahii TaxID=228899 RepID=A0A398B5S5_9BACI|nr:hypothetical protein [Peribacillus asahii]RID84794.1 hypothetical protein D1953_13110 [Peribacillus asahii]
MQIIQNNYRSISQTAVPSSQPDVGDLLQVSVKERVSNQEAFVSIRGTTTKVQFEGNVPKQDQVFVEITGKTAEGYYTVKRSDKTPSMPAAQTNMSHSADSELTEIVKAFSSRGVSLTKDQMNVMKEFIAKGPGTAEQKAETLRVMAQKQIGVTNHTVKAVHEALNGKTLSASLMSVLDELGVQLQSRNTSTPAKSIATVRTEAQREPNVAKSIQMVEDFLKSTNLNEASKKKLEQSVSEAKKLSQAGQTVQAKVQLIQHLVAVEKQVNADKANTTAEMSASKSASEAILQVKEKVAQESNVARALEQVREVAKTENLPVKAMEKLDKVIEEVTRLVQTGQSVQAKAQLTQSLSQLEQELRVEEAQPSEVIRQVKEKVAQEPNVARALEQVREVAKAENLPVKAVKKLDKVIQEAARLVQTGQSIQAKTQLTQSLKQLEQELQVEEMKPSEVIRQVKEKAAQEPNISRVLEHVKEVAKAANLPAQAVEKLDKVIQEAARLVQTGQSVQAKVQLTRALSQLEQQLQMAEINPSEAVRQVKEKVAQEPNVARALEQVKELVKTVDLPAKVAEQLDKAMREAIRLVETGQSVQAKAQLTQALSQLGQELQVAETKPSEAIYQVKEKVAQEPNVARALEQVKEVTKSANLPTKVIEKLDKVMQEVNRLAQTGQSVQAKAQLKQALNQLEQELQVAEIKPSEVIRQVKEKVTQEPNIARALDQVKEAVKTTNLPVKAVEKLDKVIQEATRLAQTGQSVQAKVQLTQSLVQLEQDLQIAETKSSEAIRQVKEKVAQEPNIARALEQVREVAKTPNLPLQAAEKLDKVIQEAARLAQPGQSVQAKVQLTQALNQLEQELHVAEMKPSEAIRQVKEKVAQESSIARALEQVKEVVKTSNLPTKAIELEQLDKVMQEATRLAQTGQTIQAKAQLIQTLHQLEQNLQVEESPKSTAALNQLKDKIMQEPNISKAIEQTKEAIKTPGMPTQVIQKLEQAVQEATKLHSIGRDAQAKIQLTGHLNQLLQSVGTTEASATTANEQQSPSVASKDTNIAETIRNLVKDIQKDPSLAKVLDKTAALLAEQGTNEELNELKQAHDKAQQLQENGRELAARRELSTALSKVERNLGIQQSTSQENTLSQAEQYEINEAVQTLKLDSQNVMVTEITKKLSQMAIDFKTLKREITRNLDNISRMLENRNILPQANVKQILESTIHKLDNAILKGDYLLYTDMSTEKKMLAVSSQLAEAKKLLAKGEISEANKIVKEVKANIENIVFKPSDVKVKHFVSDKLGLENFSSARQMASTVEQAVQPFTNNEPSARQMYDTIRRLGLTHENDAGFSLVSKDGTSADPQQTENLKSALMKMMKNEEMKPQLMQQVEQTVNNITGQQLLNKQDSSGMQNLFFQLPYMMEKQVENIKIYVNSRKDGEKVDWENCSIYFVLETKRLGDIGVLLSSSEKNVSLTFRSNKEQLSEKLADFTEVTQERFREIGYQLQTMNVKPLNEPQASAATEERVTEKAQLAPTFTEKGYDFSI